MDERRTARVAEAVREELAELIGFELNDPRLTGVDVTQVSKSTFGATNVRRIRHLRRWNTPVGICGGSWLGGCSSGMYPSYISSGIRTRMSKAGWSFCCAGRRS